ncbi:hypothetical protein ACQPUY_15750 [Clostridium nigeriense]|uniref:hypothetical protein n=1 Tax=Clostridium nigeriense TaxID=1805470 RepID=UPI003D33B7BF
MNKLTILNEIYVILNILIEKNININFSEFKLMIHKIIDNNSTFIEHCPMEIQYEIQSLKSIINKYSDKKLLIIEITKFINAFSSISEYEQCNTDIPNIEKDKLYYKAVINSYYILDLFINNEESRFDNFKNEFYQIGVLIGKYYNDNNIIVKDIIYAKLQDLFNRYNFNYSLPVCCYL